MELSELHGAGCLEWLIKHNVWKHVYYIASLLSKCGTPVDTCIKDESVCMYPYQIYSIMKLNLKRISY